MEIIYRAFDGKEFDDQFECETYEYIQRNPSLLLINFYDKNGKKFNIDMYDVFNDDVYNSAEKIVVDDEKQLEALMWLTEETGWCEFEQIDAPGTWVRHERELYMDGLWEKE